MISAPNTKLPSLKGWIIEDFGVDQESDKISSLGDEEMTVNDYLETIISDGLNWKRPFAISNEG